MPFTIEAVANILYTHKVDKCVIARIIESMIMQEEEDKIAALRLKSHERRKQMANSLQIVEEMYNVVEADSYKDKKLVTHDKDCMCLRCTNQSY